MANPSSRKIILEHILYVLALLSGIGLGVFLNNHVLHDGHEINWNIVIAFISLAVIGLFIDAIVSIKKLNKEQTLLRAERIGLSEGDCGNTLH